MSVLPMFYGSVTPVSSERHRSHRLRPGHQAIGFAAGAHLIPAVVEEYAAAAHHIPIVFAPTDTGFASVFLCGLKPGRNLFVAADGGWNAPYLPAYLRRYPFILGERGSEEPILCVDEAYSEFGEGGDGQPLFADDGRPTAFLGEVMTLVSDYAAAARRTDDALAVLAELKLMRAVTMNIARSDGTGSSSIHGLSVVDEDKLNGLDEAAFGLLRQKGIVGAIYAHLFSIGSTGLLADLLDRDAAGSGQAA